MEFLFLGFFTGLSLILALGAQNIFVIEQGLKKQYVFIVCLICSISDLILIFLGISYLNILMIFLLNKLNFYLIFYYLFFLYILSLLKLGLIIAISILRLKLRHIN